MPLVTRQANQGNLFSQADEPTDWLNGDIWVDTDNSNVFVNNGGSAVQIGIGTLGSASEAVTVDSGATALEYAESTANSILALATLDHGGSNRFYSFSRDEVIDNTDPGETTESNATNEINFAFTITRMSVKIFVGPSTISFDLNFRDDGGNASTLTISDLTTGIIETGAITDAVAAGSLCCFNLTQGNGTTQFGSITAEIQS